MQGWARLNAAQRERFFRAFVKAALRLDALALRAWLRRRLQNPPLAEPIDPASFIFADADIALLLRAGKAPGDAAAGPDRDEAEGGPQASMLGQGGCRITPLALIQLRALDTVDLLIFNACGASSSQFRSDLT